MGRCVMSKMLAWVMNGLDTPLTVLTTGVPVVPKTLWILMATPNNIVFRLWALSRDNQSLRCRLHKKSMTEKDIFIEKTCLYFSFSDSMAFLLSLTLARKAGPRTDITTLVENHDSYHINIQRWMSDANFFCFPNDKEYKLGNPRQILACIHQRKNWTEADPRLWQLVHNRHQR